MTSIVQTNPPPDVNLGVAKGQNRTVFRNPRGNKRYYAFYQEDGTLLGQPARVRCDWSVDGIGWTEFANTAVSFTGTYDVNIPSMDAFDVIMHDDGLKLEVWIVGIGFQSFNGWHMLKYIYGTVTDSGNAIIWNTQQTIDNNLDHEGLDVPFSVALARTDNGEIVVAYTEQYKTMGKAYILTNLRGSDGDGAAPSWSGFIAWDDPSGSTNNQNKGEVWSAFENYGPEQYEGNAVHLFARIPSSNTSSDYNVVWDNLRWTGGAFAFVLQNDVTTPDPDTGKVLSAIIDPTDYAQVIYWDGDSSSLKSAKANIPGGEGLDLERTITNSDVDACTFTLDDDALPEVPTSDELVGGWTSTEGDLHSAVDEGNIPNDADYIDNTLDNSCRLGGFTGGLTTITIRTQVVGAGGGTFSLSTYKGGVFVENLVTDRGMANYPFDFGYDTTDADWDELYLTSTKNASDSVRVFNLHVDNRRLYAFYHKSGDSVDWNYKVASFRTVIWSAEKTVSFHETITALSSWNRVIENSLHIAGQYGTTIFYNEHPVYKALSNTLADLEFPDQNYYLGPHST